MRKFKLLLIFTLLLIRNISAQEITADLDYFPKKEFNDKLVESKRAANGNTIE